jgi:hypothetical protein
LELRDLHTSTYIIPVSRSRKIRWTEHVAGMGEKRNAYGFLVRKSERDYFEDLVIDGRMVLE